MFKLNDVPVFWRESTDVHPVDRIPDLYNLEIFFDKKLNLIKQVFHKKTDKFLNEIYKASENIGYLQDDNPLQEIYGPEFIEFILQELPDKGSSILEIGCGGMYTLQKLSEQGFSVNGCDPSPIAVAAAKNNNIPLYNCFFPNKKINKKFNAILHYDVLEHIWSPHDFMKQCIGNLQIGGRVIFVVPDCSSQIKDGDISLFIHQHVNFFDKQSLSLLMQNCGFSDISVKQSTKTGVLFCSGKISESFPEIYINREKQEKEIEKTATKFFKNTAINFETIDNQIERDFNGLKEHEKIGFYPPLRAMPFLRTLHSDKEKRKRVVFIDDNKKVAGKYLCNIQVPITPLTSDVIDECKVIYVCSKVFKEVMTRKITALSQSVIIRYL